MNEFYETIKREFYKYERQYGSNPDIVCIREELVKPLVDWLMLNNEPGTIKFSLIESAEITPVANLELDFLFFKKSDIETAIKSNSTSIQKRVYRKFDLNLDAIDEYPSEEYIKITIPESVITHYQTNR